MGFTMEGFWRAVHETVRKELRTVAEELGTVEDLLSGIPQYIWSVDVKSNKVIYANSPLHSLYATSWKPRFPVSPTPMMMISSNYLAWQTAVSGTTVTLKYA